MEKLNAAITDMIIRLCQALATGQYQLPYSTKQIIMLTRMLHAKNLISKCSLYASFLEGMTPKDAKNMDEIFEPLFDEAESEIKTPYFPGIYAN